MTSSRARNADTGSKPPPSALPSTSPSGRTPAWSHASSRPVRPRPVCTSSAMNSTLRSRHSRAHRREIAVGRHDDAALALDRLDEERGGVRRDRALERGELAVRHQAQPGRERSEALAILRLGGQAGDGDGAPVEVAFARDDLGAIVRHALHLVRPLARRLQRGLDRLEAGVHRQRPVHAGEPAQPREERGQPVVVVGPRGDRQPARLGGQRAQDARMRVAEAHRGVGRHAVEVASARLVPDVRAFAAHQHDRQRRVVGRAVPPLERDRERRRRRAGAEQRSGDLLDELRGRRAGVVMRVELGDLDGERRRIPHQGIERGNERRCAQAARGRRRHARRVGRIDGVEIQRHAIADGAAPHARERLVQHLLEPAPGDFAHRVDAHAQRRKERRLLRLEAAHADHAHMLRREHRALDAERIAALPE